MTYQLPEPPELKFTLQYNEALITEYGQACYQAGREAMKAECVKVREEQYEYYGYDHIFAKKIKELK